MSKKNVRSQKKVETGPGPGPDQGFPGPWPWNPGFFKNSGLPGFQGLPGFLDQGPARSQDQGPVQGPVPNFLIIFNIFIKIFRFFVKIVEFLSKKSQSQKFFAPAALFFFNFSKKAQRKCLNLVSKFEIFRKNLQLF